MEAWAWGKLAKTAVLLGLTLSAAGSASAQSYGPRSRLINSDRDSTAKPKVPTAAQASFEEEADPAPLQQPSVQRSRPVNVTYSHFGNGGEAQRAAYQRFAPNRYNAQMASRNAMQPFDEPMTLPMQGTPPPPQQNRSVAPPGMPMGQQAMHGQAINGPVHADEGWDEYGPYDQGGPGYDGDPGWQDGSCDGCGGCGDCGGCGPCGSWLGDNLSVFGGFQGFKSPVDQGGGSFGLAYGLNWGIPLIDECGIGYQLGAQIVHSNLNGTLIEDANRIQYFVTTGLFHRQLGAFGWQGGLVVDFMRDDFVVTSNLVQIRPELSYLILHDHEFGFTASIGMNKSTQFNNFFAATVQQQPTDLFAFFYRRRFANGAQARFMGGFTGNSEGLLAADAICPLTSSLAIQTAAIYLAPQKQADNEDSLREAWGLAINLVWYPGAKCRPITCNPYRPLFNVADNTNFIVNERLPNNLD